MGNIFDIAKRNMFNITTRIIGHDAIWVNSQTEEELTARVHFKYPTPKEELLPSDIYYTPTEPIMEYLQGNFLGLKEAVDSNLTEQIAIDGIGIFYVRSVIRKYDGETLVAVLAPAEE